MKILLLNYEFPPMGGGAGRATYNIAKELALLGNDVDVLTSRLKGQKAKEVHEGITIYRVPIWRKSIHECGFLGAFVYVCFAYFKLLKLAGKRNYDVMHYFFSLPTGVMTILPGKHRKVPYIVSLRGSDVPFYDPFNWPLESAHCLLKPLTVRIWRKAKSVIALSDSLRSTALKTSPIQRIGVIRNGINAELFYSKASIKDGKPLKLVTVSRLIERKGIEYILAAIAELSDSNVTLTIVGEGNYERQLKKICEDYSLQSIVKFHGYCSNEMLTSIYQDHDVFILTSIAESFGIVFLEAMASGLPIIGAKAGGIPDIVAEENGILVEPCSVNEIKEAILKMRDQPSLRREMGMENRKKILNQYGWRKVAEMYQNIYGEGAL